MRVLSQAISISMDDTYGNDYTSAITSEGSADKTFAQGQKGDNCLSELLRRASAIKSKRLSL